MTIDGLAVAGRVNHVAYPTWDTGATHRFYTEVLGFRLVASVYNDGSRGEPPNLHTFFAMGSGEVVAFFEVEGLEPPPPDGMPAWVKHLALSVDSHEGLLAWRRRLKEHGVLVSQVVNHDETWFSIYFHDPNGVLLELTYQARPLVEADAQRAARMVADWTAARARRPAP